MSMLRLIAALALVWPAAASAQWPERPVTLLVPWAAGGGTDAIARMLASGLEKELGQPFPVVNRPGAGGIIGHTEMVNAAPDGYTIGLATAEITTYWWAGTAEITYEDLTPLALVNFDAGAFNVAAASPWTDLPQALDAIREAAPGTYKLSGMPAGAAYHLAFGGLLQANGIDPTAVAVIPSQGAAPGFQELAAGGVDIVPSSLPEAQAMLESGRVKALAVMAEERLQAFPDVPTVAEALGEPWVGGTWRGLAAPKGLPDAITAELADAIETVHGSPEFREFMAARGFGVTWAKGPAFGSFMAEQHEQNGTVMQALGLAHRQ
jgi:tripartite-type tricarboxylate transporter receptor subunit TctC